MNRRAEQVESILTSGRQVVDAYRAGQSGLSEKGRVEQGDVYLFREPPNRDYRWIVVLAGQKEFFVVPADTLDLVGNHDLRIPCPTGGADLIARCAFGCWLEASCFNSGVRWMTNIASALPALREHLLRVTLGAEGTETSDEEVEADPVYNETRELTASVVNWVVTDYVCRYFDARESRTARLEAETRRGQQLCDRQQKQVAELEAKVGHLNQSLAMGMVQVEHLTASNDALSREVAELLAVRERQAKQLADQQDKLTEQQAQLASLSTKVAELLAKFSPPEGDPPS